MELRDENNNIINHKNIEHIEQELAQKYIKEHHKVLELGARYGSVSIITNKIVSDKNSHYVVEPDRAVWDCLEKNMKNNGCEFNIIKGVIGKNKYKLEGNGYSRKSVIDSSYGKSQIDIYDLPDIKFNALIVDCEGYLEIFYNENKDLFTELELIIYECDEPQSCNYDYLLSEFKQLNFKVSEKIKYGGLDYYVLKKEIMNRPMLFCSLSDRPELSAPMFEKLKEYCSYHNYKCVLEDKVLDTTRAPSWSKIPLLQREMKSNPDIPLIVWIDDDIIITNKEKRFEELIKDYTFENILISREVVPPFNCGILVVKNNQESYDYLTHIWELCEKYPEYKHKPNWEQQIFIKDYYNDQSHIFPIPYRIIQSFYRTNDRDWKEGDFSAHITGMPLETRKNMRDEVLNRIKNI
jgi:FkbM family methyltransferase